MKRSFFFVLLLINLISSVEAKREVLLGEVLDLHNLIIKGKPFVMDSPAGSYQKIFEVQDSPEKYFCLYYKVPLNTKNKGELLRLYSEKRCRLKLISEQTQKIVNISELRFFDIDLEDKMTFKVHLKTSVKEITQSFFLPFISKSRSYWPGLFPTYTPDSLKLSTDGASFVELKKDNICHQGCGELLNQCDKCPDHQWTAFLTLKCGARISGFCGDSLCGGRGQKACVRMTSLKQQLNCDEAKDHVYCSYGREVECQSNGDITCR